MKNILDQNTIKTFLRVSTIILVLLPVFLYSISLKEGVGQVLAEQFIPKTPVTPDFRKEEKPETPDISQSSITNENDLSYMKYFIKAKGDNTNSISTKASGTKEPIAGNIFFSGTAPDAYGHGVGLSQWGAYGAAQQGWSAGQILGFYYPTTVVEKRSIYSINVIGYGNMPLEDYVAGLGEIPSKACGTQAHIQQWHNYSNSQGWALDDERRFKYIIDNPTTVWDCWPEETIKAQLIAARSYAVRYGRPICTTDVCQVYVGGRKKAWAAHETKDLFVVSKGSDYNSIISAMYSANNHNGRGTADIDTIYSDKTGYGSSPSYFQSVNDTAINYDFNMNRTTWRTNSYSMSSLNNMLYWCSINCSGGNNTWVQQNIRAKIGNLRTIKTLADESGRIKKVFLIGENLQSATLAGWLFTKIFNEWIDKTMPTGEKDYIGSLTFNINEASDNLVFRLFNQQEQRHLFTHSADEKNNYLANFPSSVWKYEGIGFFKVSCSTPNSMPVYRFFNKNNKDHFYTITEGERVVYASNPGTWQFDGVAFCAFSSPVANTKPVFRLLRKSNSTHFYTINSQERDALIGSGTFTYEGIGFYVP